jgi:hypothetical protein
LDIDLFFYEIEETEFRQDKIEIIYQRLSEDWKAAFLLFFHPFPSFVLDP